MASADSSDYRERLEEAGLSDLRREALHRLLSCFLFVLLAVLIGNGVYIAQVGVAPAYVFFALAAMVGLSYRLLRLGVDVAAVVFVLGLLGVIALALEFFPYAALQMAVVIPILIATALLGIREGAITTAVSTLVVTVIAVRHHGSIALALISSAGLGSVVLLCAASLWHAFYTVLDWSWSSYEEVQKRDAELRRRQAELGRLNQSLMLAYDQIKQISAQLERARQAAEEARRLKSEFAASVSHELRTPLNLIISLSELMVVSPPPGTPPLPDLLRADVEAIYRNACHISNLIDDVLDLSQIEAHRMGLLREWTDLRTVVDQAAATVQTLFENVGLWLAVHLPDDLPPLFIDPVRVRQILINLLNNAVRFTEEGGVTISARVEGDQVVVEVADTGVGIPPQDLPSVFQEFWRSGEPRRGRRGSGLGLALSKRLAELHGGTLSVRSVPGRGSTFCLSLPLGKKAIVQEAGLAEVTWERLSQGSPLQPTIALVAPEPEVARGLRRHLEGFTIREVPDAEAAAALLDDPGLRAILVGSAAARRRLQRWIERACPPPAAAHLPVITCRLRTARTLARSLGVSEYLVKPVTQQQLQRALRRLGRHIRDLVIAEDDPEMAHVLTRMLAVLAPACRPRLAVSGQQALDLLAEQRPDGLLLDLVMPDLDGRSVLERVRQDPRLADLPVVVITARAGADDGLSAEMLEISQLGGLHLGEVCRWLRAGLAPRPPGGPEAALAPPGMPSAILA